MRKSEYVPIGLLLIVVIALALLVIFVWNDNTSNPCVNQQSFTCKDWRVQACLKTERYTLDQCVILIGGSK